MGFDGPVTEICSLQHVIIWSVVRYMYRVSFKLTQRCRYWYCLTKKNITHVIAYILIYYIQWFQVALVDIIKLHSCTCHCSFHRNWYRKRKWRNTIEKHGKNIIRKNIIKMSKLQFTNIRASTQWAICVQKSCQN